MNAAAGQAAGSIGGALIGGLMNVWAARTQADAMRDVAYNYGDYLRDLQYGLPSVRGVAQDYLNMDFERFPGLRNTDKAMGKYVALLTPEQKDLIGTILNTRNVPNQRNLAAEDLMLATLRGDYLPIYGDSPYAQPLLDALHRGSMRGLEQAGPAYARQLQAMTGGALHGAGSAIQPMSDFFQDWVQQAADVQTSALSSLWQFGRGNQMQALAWALSNPTDLETQRLGALLPVAEIPRAIRDTAIQRAYMDFARQQGLVAQRGAQALGVTAQGAGAPSYGPVAAMPDFSGVGIALGDALSALLGGNQADYAPQQVQWAPGTEMYAPDVSLAPGTAMTAPTVTALGTPSPINSYTMPQGMYYNPGYTYYGGTSAPQVASVAPGTMTPTSLYGTGGGGGGGSSAWDWLSGLV